MNSCTKQTYAPNWHTNPFPIILSGKNTDVYQHEYNCNAFYNSCIFLCEICIYICFYGLVHFLLTSTLILIKPHTT